MRKPMNFNKIRKIAKKRVKQNYFKSVLVCFAVTFILTGGISYTSKNVLDIDISNQSAIKVLEFTKQQSNSEILNNFLDKLIRNQNTQDAVFQKANHGFQDYFLNVLSSKQSMIFNMLSGATQALTGDYGATIIAIAASLIWFLVRYGLLSAFEVGRARYFLEQRKYLGTGPDRVLFPFKKKQAINVSLILLAKNLMLSLWSLTIVGYFIKYYQYSMIPYILAENPNIKMSEAFRLSKELTRGDKRHLFKISLTVIAWHLLGLVTFNLTNIFFVNPYEFAMLAEAYIELRKAKRPSLTDKELLNDRRLVIEDAKEGEYREKEVESELVKRGAKKKYTISSYILLFFIFSFVGWLYEVVIYLISEGRFVNRGTMYGPWLPIYGIGGVAILFLLQKFRKKPLLMFLSSFILCGIIEYAGGWILYHFHHARYWDYSGFFLNINGFICLESLLIFGLGGCGFTYIAGPTIDSLILKIDKRLRYIICAILLVAYGADFIYCKIAGNNSGDGIGGEISIQDQAPEYTSQKPSLIKRKNQNI